LVVTDPTDEPRGGVLRALLVFFLTLYFRVKRWLSGVDVGFDASIERMARSRTTQRIFETSGNIHSRAEGPMNQLSTPVKEMASDMGHFARDVGKTTSRVLKRFDELSMVYGRKALTHDYVNSITGHPWTVVLVVLMIAGSITAVGAPLMDPKANIDIFIPENDETRYVFERVQEDWSTDALILYCEVVELDGNVTDKATLDELWEIENDLNFARDDFGEQDDFVYSLSIGTLVASINEATGGEFGIPGTQDEIDRIIGQVPPDVLHRTITPDFKKAIITLGIIPDIEHKDKLVETREYISGSRNVHIIATGSVATTSDMQDEVSTQFTTSLVFAVGVVAVCLFLFHRTVKIILITLLPTGLAIGVTFGLLGIFQETQVIPNFIISTQVVMVGPVLVALGIAYGLHLTNRFGEEVGPDPRARLATAINTTGRSIWLSAVTTAIGFASLIATNMAPIRMLGIGLSMGIMLCFIMTMLLVPSMILITRYEKVGAEKGLKSIAKIPTRYPGKILAISLVLCLYSATLISSVSFDADLTDLSPEGMESVEAIHQYSAEFNSGQLGMFRIEGYGAGALRERDVLIDMERVQEKVKAVGSGPKDGISEAMRPVAYSIVDLMKAINITFPVPTVFQPLVGGNEQVSGSYWNLMMNYDILTDPRLRELLGFDLVDLFYDNLNNETKFLFVSRDYSRALIIVDMPMMDMEKTAIVVDAVNAAIQGSRSDQFNSDPLTGVAALVVAVNELLTINNLVSLAVCLLMVFLLLWLFSFRSIRLAALTMIPVSVVVALQPLTMVAIDLPMSVFTAMVSSIVVGIGIDFGIHISKRITEKGETIASVESAVEHSGMSFLEATVTTVLGLVATMVIPILALRQFIILVAVMLIYSVMGAIFILPSAFILYFRRRGDGGEEDIPLYARDEVELEIISGSDE